MRICLVTSFPPSHERLNEYGYHLAAELRSNPFLSLTILGDEFDGPREELPGFDLVRCWRPNQFANAVKLLRIIRKLDPDVVWFNLVFSTFGVNPAAAFLGLCAPALARLAGRSTHVTLHHLMESVNLRDVGVRFPRLYRVFGRIATHLLLLTNSVTVLLPAYRRTLVHKYRGRNVHFRAHGVFSGTEEPDFSQRGKPHRILAFGKWGTHKRVELLLDAFPQVLKAFPGCRLVIAGEDHPAAPDYLQSLRERCRTCPEVEITGYVSENKIGALFNSASVLVMPYTSASGSSGVAHLACQFGLPIICADIPDFRDMALEEGLAIEFYKLGNRDSLAATIVGLLRDEAHQREMAGQNYSAAVRLTMPEIVRQYLRSFNWQLRRRRRSVRSLRRRALLPLGSSVWNQPLLTVPASATTPSASTVEIVKPGSLTPAVAEAALLREVEDQRPRFEQSDQAA